MRLHLIFFILILMQVNGQTTSANQQNSTVTIDKNGIPTTPESVETGKTVMKTQDKTLGVLNKTLDSESSRLSEKDSNNDNLRSASTTGTYASAPEPYAKPVQIHTTTIGENGKCSCVCTPPSPTPCLPNPVHGPTIPVAPYAPAPYSQHHSSYDSEPKAYLPMLQPNYGPNPKPYFSPVQPAYVPQQDSYAPSLIYKKPSSYAVPPQNDQTPAAIYSPPQHYPRPSSYAKVPESYQAPAAPYSPPPSYAKPSSYAEAPESYQAPAAIYSPPRHYPRPSSYSKPAESYQALPAPYSKPSSYLSYPTRPSEHQTVPMAYHKQPTYHRPSSAPQPHAALHGGHKVYNFNGIPSDAYMYRSPNEGDSDLEGDSQVGESNVQSSGYSSPSSADSDSKPSTSNYSEKPKDQYTPSKLSNDASKPSYETSKPSYEAPKPSYETPKSSYEAPKPSYGGYSTHRPYENSGYGVPSAAYLKPTNNDQKYALNPSYELQNSVYGHNKPTYAAKPTYQLAKPAYKPQSQPDAYSATSHLQKDCGEDVFVQCAPTVNIAPCSY